MTKYFFRREDCSRHNIFPGVDIFTLAGNGAMLSLVEFAPHAVVERHSHPHEQMGLLLEGELTFEVGDQCQTLQPGEMWCIPGGVEHKAIAGPSGVRALDLFCPCGTIIDSQACIFRSG